MSREVMTYISFCSGIEAATVAWHALGWRPIAFCEIDRFASRVLAHHYRHVPNLGDFTKVDWSQYTADICVGGTPCQAFSVAGLRKSLADERGNLTTGWAKRVYHHIRYAQHFVPVKLEGITNDQARFDAVIDAARTAKERG